MPHRSSSRRSGAGSVVSGSTSVSRTTSRRRGHHHSSSRARPALTENNLKTHSEVSSVAPSQVPRGAGPNYRSPYAETQAYTQVDSRSLAITERRPPMAGRSMSEFHGHGLACDYEHGSYRAESAYHSPPPTPGSDAPGRRKKSIDMNMAYGEVPPDLEDRIDLDPSRQEEAKERRARDLVRQIESVLDEAHCVKHSATHTISHLQRNPDSAAAVALTLAELSGVVTKMSPAFLGVLKGTSPAVFALLASPQFLIGSAAVVGVTVVMFGGWKIVKRVKDAQAARAALAYEGRPALGPAVTTPPYDMDREAMGYNYPRAPTEYAYAPAPGGGSMDEALVLDDDISAIDSWRRGIIPEFGEDDDESADMELITPQAEKARLKAIRREKGETRDPYDDLRSRRTTNKAPSTAPAKKNSSSSSSKRAADKESDKKKKSSSKRAGSTVSSATASTVKPKAKPSLKAIEDGSRAREADSLSLVFRPKGQPRQNNMLKALFKNPKDKELVKV